MSQIVMAALLAFLLFLLILPLALLLTTGLYLRFRRDLDASHVRLAGISTIVETARGAIEYAEMGTGAPVLFVHGAGGGFDQGLAMMQAVAAAGFRIIAPSRFGYLGTPLPDDASPRAQADAHAALLDALDVPRAAVIGGSAGAPSAMQFALRHKARCAALVLVVPITYCPDHKARAASYAARRFSPLAEKILLALVGSDFVFWAATKLLPNMVIRRVLATDPRLLRTASPAEQARMARILESILPIGPRLPGILNDAKISVAIPRYAIEEIEAPTLIISLKDDGYKTYPGAAYSAGQIPGARFIGYERGGHLWLGHQDEVMAEIAQFLKTTGV